MIRSVLSLTAAAGRRDALEKWYSDNEVLTRARAFPGCSDAVLLRALTGGERTYLTSAEGDPITHLVVADWESPEDYQRWTADPWRAVGSRQLAEFLHAQLLDTGIDTPVVGRLYELV